MAQERLTVQVTVEIGDSTFTVATADYDLAKHIVYSAAIHMDEVVRLSSGNQETQAFLAGWRVITDKIGLSATLAYRSQGDTKAPVVRDMHKPKTEPTATTSAEGEPR